MKINQKLSVLAILMTTLTVLSCSDKDEESKLSKDEAKSQIAEFNSSAVGDLQAITETKGLQAIKEISALANSDDPFGARINTDKRDYKQIVRRTSRSLRKLFIAHKVLSARKNGESSFVFAQHVGVYEWNATKETFGDRKESSINAIQIFFPSDSLQTENNAELRITEYTEMEIDGFFEPQIIKAVILIDGTEVVSLDFDVEWSEDKFPVKAAITFSIKPYSFEINFDDSSTSASSSSVSLKKSDETIIAASATANYKNNSKTFENLNNVEGFLQLKNLKIQGKIDVKGVDTSANGDLNDYVHLALYADNRLVGDIVFVNEPVAGGLSDYVAYLQYTDGSKEKLEDVMKDVIDEVKTLTDGLKE